MGKIINLGRFEMDENFSIVENVDAHEIKGIISKLGPGWRIASFSELKYIANLNFKFNILENLSPKGDNLYVCGDMYYGGCYVDEKKLILISTFQTMEGDPDDFILDYILVKDI